MKILSILILMFTCVIVQATPTTNVCRNDYDEATFKEALAIEILKLGGNKSLNIVFPSEFKSPYKFHSLSLRLYRTDVYKRGDRTHERRRMILESYIQTKRVDLSHIAYVSFLDDVENDVKLILTYREETPPGVIRFGGEVCSFELNWGNT